MPADGSELRFHPPRLEVEAIHRWVFAAAFGGQLPPLPPEAAEEVCELAARLALLARIGVRRKALPPRVEERARGARRRAAVDETLRLEALARVAELARQAGIRIAALKFAALHLGGSVAPGSRGASDLDLLVPTGDEERFREALAAAGFQSVGGAGYEHHDAALVHARLGAVEVHRHVPGVTTAGRDAFAGLEELAAAGLLSPSEEVAGLLVPERPVVLAHVLAHGLGQHGLRPASYPMARMLTDLVDLEATSADLATVEGLLAPQVVRAEVAAALTLAEGLGRGDVGALDRPEDPDGRLLRHVLAGALQPEYRERLKVQEAARPFGEGGPWRARWRSVVHALILTREQIDAIYGPQGSAWRYALMRLWRPFDLVLRVLRAGRRRR